MQPIHPNLDQSSRVSSKRLCIAHAPPCAEAHQASWFWPHSWESSCHLPDQWHFQDGGLAGSGGRLEKSRNRRACVGTGVGRALELEERNSGACVGTILKAGWIFLTSAGSPPAGGLSGTATGSAAGAGVGGRPGLTGGRCWSICTGTALCLSCLSRSLSSFSRSSLSLFSLISAYCTFNVALVGSSWWTSNSGFIGMWNTFSGAHMTPLKFP